MIIKTLIGAGDKIMIFSMPIAIIGIVLNILFPSIFMLNLSQVGLIIGVVLLIIGVPIWLTSAVLILINVPKNKLITTGPFAILLHPLYTAVALLVIPGVGFLFDSWLGLVVGLIFYIVSRIFSVEEDKFLSDQFREEYKKYREKVIIPWL